MNRDEILRLGMDKMVVILRGNKPYLIDKKIYTEHTLAKDLRDIPINEYIPSWQKRKNEFENIGKIKKSNKMSFKDF